MRGSAAFRTGVAPGGALAPGWVKNELWRKARAVPSLDLRFAENKSLVDATTGASLVTFTRASSGTFVGSDGVLRTAVTNLLLRSEEFDNVYWTKNAATITANATAAPNAAITADKLVETAVNSQHFAGAIGLGLASAIYTVSVYVKAAERTELSIFIDTSVTRRTQYFNLSTGALGASSGGITSTIQAAGNGWYRCSVTLNAAESLLNAVYASAVSGNNSYLGDGTSGIYVWGAQLEAASTAGEYIPTTSVINSAPRFDHNPTTGESLGLLVEEQRTNSIRNSTGVGAVAGTPGTLPTNWVGTTIASGLSRQIVAVGAVDGINYVRFRISGTTSTPFVFFGVSTFDSTNASTSQTWTASSYYQLQAGSLTGVTLQHEIARFGVANAYLGSTVLPFTPGSSALIRQRYALTTTVSDASLTAINYGLQMVVPTSGTVVDFTVDIGLPQLEQGAFATSVIPTTTAAATRSADVASITGTAFSSWYRQDEGTLFWEGIIDSALPSGNFGQFFDFRLDGLNRLSLYWNPTTTNNVGLFVQTGGVTQVTTQHSLGTNVQSKLSGAYKINDFASSLSGSVVQTDTSGTLPTSIVASIGSAAGFGVLGRQQIRRLCYWPTRLANNTLQSITQ